MIRPFPHMIRALVVMCLLLSPFTPACAHELDANRVTLVQRSPTHLSISFLIDYPSALKRLLLPNGSMDEFLFRYAGMPQPEFRLALEQTQRLVAESTHLEMDGNTSPLRPTWKWPAPDDVKTALQEQVMQRITGGESHQHAALTEIRAEVVAEAEIASVKLTVSDAFLPLMVVSYRPRQQWLPAGKRQALIDF